MAEKYTIMNNLSDVIPEFHGSPYNITSNLVETPYQAHGQVFGKGGYTLKNMKDALEYADNGYVYQVKTPPQDFYLQYEKPLSQQSQTIQNILKEKGLYNNPNQLGKDLYHSLLDTYKGMDIQAAKNALNNELSMYGIKGTSINYPFLGEKGEWKVTYQPEDVKVLKQIPVSEVKQQLKKPIVPNNTTLSRTLKPTATNIVKTTSRGAAHFIPIVGAGMVAADIYQGLNQPVGAANIPYEQRLQTASPFEKNRLMNLKYFGR